LASFVPEYSGGSVPEFDGVPYTWISPFESFSNKFLNDLSSYIFRFYFQDLWKSVKGTGKMGFQTLRMGSFMFIPGSSLSLKIMGIHGVELL
jgi:hypothetical protein